jgi:uncharacterized glyoxalase superfamily protein PhnB
LMSDDHPTRPPGPESLGGRGAFVTVQVDDLAAVHERLVKAGVAIEYGPRSEAWGQRRLVVRDPAGTMVDVVEHIQPEAGYWDRFPPRA